MTRADLVDDADLTVDLLANPLEWRVRSVEEIAIDSATSARRRRSLQASPIRDLVGDRVAATDVTAMIAVGVATIPRGPLSEFDVEGPIGNAWLLPRAEIARRETHYIERLAAELDHGVNDRVRDLLVALLGYTGEWFATKTFSTVEEYLEAGMGRALSPGVVDEWREIGSSCHDSLRGRLDRWNGYSAPENPLLVAPELLDSGIVASEDEATKLFAEYAEILESAAATATPRAPNAADDLLNVLADYGNHFELIVATEVPLDEPFTIKFAERRGMRLSPFLNAGSQELVIADCRTNHVSVRVEDPGVRLTDFKAREPSGSGTAFGTFLATDTAESRAFYAHQRDRDYRVQLTFRLRPLLRLQLVPYFVSAVLFALAAGLAVEQPTDLRTLALVLGPSALAASILLVREPSTLGSRVKLLSTYLLAGSLVLGVAVAAILFATHHLS